MKKDFTLEPGTSFMANGKKYTVSDSCRIGRMEILELLEHEYYTKVKTGTLKDVMENAMALLNELKIGEAYVLMHNKINLDQRTTTLRHPLLRLATVFIDQEGEDFKYLTETKMKEKISDWSEEGLPAEPFLAFGVKLQNDFMLHYNEIIAHTLQQIQALKEALKELSDIQHLIKEQNSGEHQS
jgi:hypothetical protein